MTPRPVAGGFTRLAPRRRAEGGRTISWHEDSGNRPGNGPPQPTPPPYGQPPYGQPQYPPPPGPPLYAGQPQYPPPGWSPYGPPTQGTNGLAIASLVCSLVSPFVMGVGSVLAVIFGLIARRQIKERNETGDGMAIAGIVIGILGIIGIVVLIVVIIAVADDLESYDSYDEFENVEMIRAGVTLAWDNVAAGLAGVRTALVGS